MPKPRSVERVPVRLLAPHEQKELEALLAAAKARTAGDRYLSDEGDTSAWWLLLLIAGCGAAGACFTQVDSPAGILWFPKAVASYGLVGGLMSQRYQFGLLASLALIAWVVVTWVRNHGRRGFATTSFATLRVKGPKVAMLRHADVARIEWTQHATRKQRFSVLSLTAGDGRVLTLYVHAGWVRAAIAQIDQARAAAKLPPLSGDARIVPE